MNCDSWLDPKNSLMAATTGRALIKDAAVTVAASQIVMRSLMIRSIRISPIRNWFCSSSPTARTRRLPRWSMSSGSPPPLLSSISLRRIARPDLLVHLHQGVVDVGGRVLIQGGLDELVLRIAIDVGKQCLDLVVAGVAERTDEGGDRDLPLAVDLDGEYVLSRGLDLQPGA